MNMNKSRTPQYQEAIKIVDEVIDFLNVIDKHFLNWGSSMQEVRKLLVEDLSIEQIIDKSIDDGDTFEEFVVQTMLGKFDQAIVI